MSAETLMVRGGIERSPHGETAEAVFMMSGYVYESAEAAEKRFTGEAPGHVYSRLSNPTAAMFENRMTLIEGAEAACGTAAGMTAVTTALMAQVRSGDHVIAAWALFGSCRYIVEDYLLRWGVETSLVDGRDTAAFEKAMRKNTRAVFVETPTNPALELVDIAGIAEIAHANGAVLIVDNVFATTV